MAAIFTFDKVNKIIEVDIGSTSVSVQEIYDACKDYEARVYNLEVAKIADASGKQELGGTVKVGITVTLIDWKIKFADRPPSTYILCEISGGNLVGYDTSLETYYVPIEPAAYVTVVRTSSSSATLMDLEAIQYASFQNGVWIDAIRGQAGTTYPLGTAEHPVDNLADAKAIASERGFDKIYLIGNFTFEAADNIDNFQIEGQNPILSTLTVTSGCSTSGTEFTNCKIVGTLSGLIDIKHCALGTLSGLLGCVCNTVLEGHIKLGGSYGDVVNFVSCWMGSTTIGLLDIDMNGDGPTLGMRAWTGAINIKNKSGASKVAIDFLSGRMAIADTVTAGTFFVRGVGEITENLGTGIVVHDNPLTQTIKAETDKIQTGIIDAKSDFKADVSPLATEDGGRLENVNTETDKIAAMKTETDKIPDVKTETDKIPDVKLETDKIQGAVDDIGTVDANVLSILSDTGFIKDVEGGKWEISGDEMIFYKSDNVTEVMRFTIARDIEGNPIMRTRQ